MCQTNVQRTHKTKCQKMNKVIKNGLCVKLCKRKIQMTSKQFKRYLIS